MEFLLLLLLFLVVVGAVVVLNYNYNTLLLSTLEKKIYAFYTG